MNNDKIKILICCHKDCKLPNSKQYLPIQVGAVNAKYDLGLQRDDRINGHICDNISEKNKSYCELTAIYWAWKNIREIYPNLEYIGLNHYRRYFNFNSIFFQAPIKKKNVRDIIDLEGGVPKNIEDKLNKGYIVTPEYHNMINSVAEQYCNSHIKDDFIVMKNVIYGLKDEKYKKAFMDVMEYGHKFRPYNMFIMKWKDFDQYCQWLFGVLEKIECHTNIENYDSVQCRIYGYMAERLFNVWLSAEKKRCFNCGVLFLGDGKAENDSMLMALMRNLYHDINWELKKI